MTPHLLTAHSEVALGFEIEEAIVKRYAHEQGLGYYRASYLAAVAALDQIIATQQAVYRDGKPEADHD